MQWHAVQSEYIIPYPTFDTSLIWFPIIVNDCCSSRWCIFVSVNGLKNLRKLGNIILTTNMVTWPLCSAVYKLNIFFLKRNIWYRENYFLSCGFKKYNKFHISFGIVLLFLPFFLFLIILAPVFRDFKKFYTKSNDCLNTSNILR